MQEREQEATGCRMYIHTPCSAKKRDEECKDHFKQNHSVQTQQHKANCTALL